MLVLLPPSEGKARPRRGRPMELEALSFPELTDARRQVVEALVALSSRPYASQVLKVGATLAEEVAANAHILTAPAVRARELYTGVLYDALEIGTLTGTDMRRANSRLLVISALHGALRPTDRVSCYRLAMDVDLPGAGPLARFWAPRLAEVLPAAAGSGVVVDCRSASYRAAWRPGSDGQGRALAERWVLVDVPGASHWAKHTRGLVARRLCQVPALRRVSELPAALGEGFRTELVLPIGPGRPWTALVTAR